jgi:hypothetical protein
MQQGIYNQYVTIVLRSTILPPLRTAEGGYTYRANSLIDEKRSDS